MLANLALAPERGHTALLKALAKRSDALGGEFATSFVIDPAEPILIQTARDKPLLPKWFQE